ncbi:MAG: Lrp/AsnC family transcriptional regulator [Actinomycetia bacterium]|nr:Lrp/AsnC family transcriptional regulator [Actinomycetes bacterium]MCP4961034.1 Lrp/AsnC family transcriptional regulator [Actinomycetes bacterium]
MPTDTNAIDPIDEAILQVVSSEGRISNADLAERVGLSPSATHRRLRRLEDDGVILGYRAILDQASLGLGTTVFVEIRLESQREDLLEAFEEAATGVPEIVGCHLISGDADYLLRVQADGVAGYEKVHTTHLARLPGVVRIRSNFAMRSVFDRP